MSSNAISEEILVIETPERVPLHFALASIGNRFLACAFDHTLQITAIVVFYIAFTLIGNVTASFELIKDGPKWVIAILILIAFLIWSSYFILFEWFWSGQTPGKRWLKLRVIREDGRPITFFEAAVRNLLRIFDIMPFPFYSIGLISVFASFRDQRVGDMVAGTVVVREREAEAPTFDQVFTSPVSDSALRRSFKQLNFTADLQPLKESEIAVVETYLRRRWDLPDTARQWMAWRVATPLLFKIKPAYDPNEFSYEAFLEELLHRYRDAHRFTD